MEFIIFVGISLALVFGTRFLIRRAKTSDVRKAASIRKMKSATDEHFHSVLTSQGFVLKGRKADARHTYTREEPNKDITEIRLAWGDMLISSSKKQITITRRRKTETAPREYRMAAVWGDTAFVAIEKQSYASEVKVLQKLIRTAEKAANKDIIKDSF